MFSRDLHYIDPALIIINREQRQRQQNLDIGDLIPSIRARGIQNPLILKYTATSDELELVAGERRLLTAQFLKLSEVPYRLVTEMSAIELQIVELEENIKRQDLTWQDKARAMLRIHSLYVAEDADWSTEQTAGVLGYDEAHFYRMVGLGEAIEAGDTSIMQAETIANALTIMTRRRQRATGEALNRILEVEDDQDVLSGPSNLGHSAGMEEESSLDGNGNQNNTAELATTDFVWDASSSSGRDNLSSLDRRRALPYAIICADAHSWLANYEGPKFNFLHCDLPYGVALNAQAGQAGFEGGGYDSSPEIYWQLCASLVNNWDKFMYPSSHVMFWISMKFYTDTVEYFQHASNEGLLPGSLKINPTPLTWLKTDNKGIIPDALRGPRQITEAALLMSTGDRHIVKPVSNGYGCPTAKGDGSIHTNEKPEPMLRHFLSMLVDKHSRVFDPTCGSGTSIRAVEALGAEAALGLEFNPEFAERAQMRLLSARSLRALSDIVTEAEQVTVDSESQG